MRGRAADADVTDDLHELSPSSEGPRGVLIPHTSKRLPA